ncbi:MAG: tRNA (N6-isopentenyl adenosine(37)-C2)-methylthiotransferase MiaB [Sphingomonadaceae bacterium]|uniref:tRNA (N6-isopentenyl adenosine(37)-C2)-methylthiotransferase MiaB n=1 Tax=Thermaurantiacus sp. TaxID=2820283 RepID=UPI00298F320E|nr:tRNA (N6-isopentenyl adenosine(37)-C2)-methylthiotransferase MiaB [Thermaurantiacus sp.]MCS6985916.1 tRNA (N6-isopentenyl adenosine(37)-C2)-methylthiotransferase MiaB [Sphingomonadaceae bacterium]MDW8414868.1 tRNA (N6-isopentenyl adenosine(37)-C2)-methylthiotransferase MiaB [Thermaurantiacus sp.]
MTRPLRFSIRSYGCQMNVYDAQRMGEALAAAGHRPVDDDAPADVRVFNTCHIREKAAEKVYSDIGRIVAEARARGEPRPLIVVAGCTAQAEGEELARRAPAVDVIVGPQAYHRLPELVGRARTSPGVVLDLDMPAEPKFRHLPPRAPRAAPSSFLTVQEGCDKFCTFCVVPYTRGAEASRPVEDVLAEARALLAAGARELVLLGQNVNAWARPGTDFAGLLAAVAALPGLERLRYTTSHPRDVTPSLIHAHAAVPQLMPFLHLPVQSGSDRILTAMNRRHTAADYRETVARLRAARPDLALSSDFIVGFPGESEEDFEATLALVEEVGFAQAYSFRYSPRPGTPAADRPDQVPEAVKAERLGRLQALLSAQQYAFNRACLGRVTEVLVERPGRHRGQWTGRSPWGQAVVVEADLSPGALVEVELAQAGPHSLVGRPTGRVR